MKREFNEDHTPLAYFITFRCYGTWLHGDERGSVDRHHNRYGAPLIQQNVNWLQHNQRSLKNEPVTLGKEQRTLVETSIKESCEIRGWRLHAANVRTNHVHLVVTAACGPSRILNAVKSNATRTLRQRGSWLRTGSPWADSGSKRYLWTEEHLIKAIEYVELDQGDKFPVLDEHRLTRFNHTPEPRAPRYGTACSSKRVDSHEKVFGQKFDSQGIHRLYTSPACYRKRFRNKVTGRIQNA